MTGSQLAYAVLRELDVIAGTDTPDAADVSYVLGLLNRVLDDWSAEFGPAYVDTVASYTITPSLQPHTIGPTGTWVVTQRPVSIEAANVIVGVVRTQLSIISIDDWMGMSDPTYTDTEPSALHYRPTHPNGSVYLFPVPTAANSIELQTRGVLSQLTLSGTAVLPPGYQSALVLTAAEQAAPHFHAAPRHPLIASRARGRIAAANATTPRLVSDYPGADKRKRGESWGSGSTEWIR